MIQRRTKQPPEEIVSQIRGKEILLAILGSLLIVLLANVATIFYLPKHGTNWGDRIIEHKWQMVLNMNEPVDWLILGDSGGATAVVPSIIDQRLGGTSVNLCTHGGLGIVNDAWMLDAYIERLGPPKHVLIVHFPSAWNTPPVLYNLLQIPLGWDFWSRLQPPVKLSLRQSFDAFLIRYAPLYSHSTTVGLLLKTPWLALASDLSFQDNGLLLVPKANPSAVIAQAEEMISSVKGTEVVFSDVAKVALEHIAALAEEYDFDVYLANGPMYKGLSENQEYVAYLNEFSNWLDTFAAKHERVYYILRTPVTFPADLMELAVHVIGSAAPLYTEALVSDILDYGQNSISH
jgi:hypothetical protein